MLDTTNAWGRIDKPLACARVICVPLRTLSPSTSDSYMTDDNRKSCRLQAAEAHPPHQCARVASSRRLTRPLRVITTRLTWAPAASIEIGYGPSRGLSPSHSTLMVGSKGSDQRCVCAMQLVTQLILKYQTHNPRQTSLLCVLRHLCKTTFKISRQLNYIFEIHVDKGSRQRLQARHTCPPGIPARQVNSWRPALPVVCKS